MHKIHVRRFVGLLATVGSFIVGVGQKPCHIDYANQNQVDYESRNRVGVVGVVTDPYSTPMRNACVAVFTEKEHRFILGRTSDANGRFRLPLLAEGDYRLVVQADGFAVANLKFRKVPETRADSVLHVHLRVSGIDTTSYIDNK